MTNKQTKIQTKKQKSVAPSLTLPNKQQGRKEMFYLMTHSAHFIYGYMVILNINNKN